MVEDDIELIVLGVDGEFCVVPLLAVNNLGLALHQLTWPVAHKLPLAIPCIEVDRCEVGLAIHCGGIGNETLLFFALGLLLGFNSLQLLIPFLHEFIAQVIFVVMTRED